MKKNNFSKSPLILFDDGIASYGVIRSLGPLGVPIFVVSETGKGVSSVSKYTKSCLVFYPHTTPSLLKS